MGDAVRRRPAAQARHPDPRPRRPGRRRRRQRGRAAGAGVPAARDRHVTISEQSDGRLRLAGILDTEAAAALRAAIDPLTTPTGPDDTRTPGQRRHDALADVCRLALRTGELPRTAAISPRLSSPAATTGWPGSWAPALSTSARVSPPRPCVAGL
ncbi:DUF222 domain-containing protein [Micromonospora sp. M12]